MLLKITDSKYNSTFSFCPEEDATSSLGHDEIAAVIRSLALQRDVTVGSVTVRYIEDWMPVTEWAAREGISRQRAHSYVRSGRLKSKMRESGRGPICHVWSRTTLESIKLR
jgi:hypothetical protein